MPKRIYSQQEIEESLKIGLPALVNKATQLQRRFCGDRVSNLVRFDGGDSFRMGRQIENETHAPELEATFRWAIEDAEMDGENEVAHALKILKEVWGGKEP